jgi:hypothetical protein
MQYTRRALSSLLTWLPGGPVLTERKTGGTGSAEYCYSVYLRHLAVAMRNSAIGVPDVVAELGPGDSLGAGLASLLSGTRAYYAIDDVQYARGERDLAILDELADLLSRRLPVNETWFGLPVLGTTVTPDRLVDAERLAQALAPTRVAAIRAAILGEGNPDGITIDYGRDWSSVSGDERERPALAFSEAVLEHVADIESIYRGLYDRLAPGGITSHEIDFTSHGFARNWNGHWTYSDKQWRLVTGRRRYAINRQPLSAHLHSLEQAGFKIVFLARSTTSSTVTRRELAPRFADITDDDLTTCSAFLQATR